VRNLVRAGADAARVRLLRSFDPALLHRPESELEVPDPYEWPGDGFESVYRMLDAACAGLLEFLLDQD
jgi:protein-tyrosine phosphatase